ncbi:MAG: hemolysin D, partial [Planctomycetota bacterium]
MSFNTASIDPTNENSVGMRARPDLVVQESLFQDERCWVIKDPVAMKYFRLRPPEYVVLEALRHRVSYEQLKRKLLKKFPEFDIRIEAVQQLVVSLHQFGLLVSNSSGQAIPLQKRRVKETKQKITQFLFSLISLRLPGWDPENFLNWAYPKVRWFFSLWFTCLVALTCLAAAVLVLSNFSAFMSKLPNMQQFFAIDNILVMGLILMGTKTIHEMGHGLMCKHFGGECHEIGFMLLVLMPAMYCNTSDSWTLPNRWHR